METVEKNIVELTIAGRNVTADVSPYVSRVCYTDKVEAESDDVSIVLEDTEHKWVNEWYPTEGDTLTLKIGKPGEMLDCGLFEIDQVEVEGPPDIFTIKAIAAAITKSLRTKNSKPFEKQSLKKIAQYFADKHGLTLTGDIGKLNDIAIERKTQDNQSDIAFLTGLAREYGLLFSVRGKQLVFMDEEQLEAANPVATIYKTALSRYTFTDKTSQIYTAATVAGRNAKANAVKKWNIQPSGTEGEKDTLVVYSNVEDDSQAQAQAKAALRNKNKEKMTGTLSLPGNTMLVAGATIELPDMGKFSGKWYITSSAHNESKDGGYTTDLTIRKVMK